MGAVWRWTRTAATAGAAVSDSMYDVCRCAPRRYHIYMPIYCLVLSRLSVCLSSPCSVVCSVLSCYLYSHLANRDLSDFLAVPECRPRFCFRLSFFFNGLCQNWKCFVLRCAPRRLSFEYILPSTYCPDKEYGNPRSLGLSLLSCLIFILVLSQK